MRKLINILLLLAATGALASASVGLARRLASENAGKNALAAMLEKNAALKAQIAALEATETTTGLAAAKLAYENYPVRATGTWGNFEKPEYKQQRNDALVRHMRNDREFGMKRYAVMRSNVDIQYGPFYRLHQLTKEQTDALSEVLFQRALLHDLANAGKQAGGSDTAARRAMAAADAELAAAARDALGADLFKQFQLYEHRLPAWAYVNNLGSMLSLVDMPLSLEQASRLADAIANANTPFQKSGKVTLAAFTYNYSAQDWAAVDAAAADFLTPEQLDFFKNTEVSSVLGANFRSRQLMEMYVALGESGVRKRPNETTPASDNASPGDAD